MKLRRGESGRNVQAKSQPMTGNMEESSRIERTSRGRWWSGDCSPRGRDVAVGEDVDGEVGLEGGGE